MDRAAVQEINSIWPFLKILAACIATAAAVTSMLYDRFESKESASAVSSALERRLDRIESKIDAILINDRKGN